MTMLDGPWGGGNQGRGSASASWTCLFDGDNRKKSQSWWHIDHRNFAFTNRNKRGVALGRDESGRPEGRADLICACRVVVENVRVGCSRSGAGLRPLAARNTRPKCLRIDIQPGGDGLYRLSTPRLVRLGGDAAASPVSRGYDGTSRSSVPHVNYPDQAGPRFFATGPGLWRPLREVRRRTAQGALLDISQRELTT